MRRISEKAIPITPIVFTIAILNPLSIVAFGNGNREFEGQASVLMTSKRDQFYRKVAPAS